MSGASMLSLGVSNSDAATAHLKHGKAHPLQFQGLTFAAPSPRQAERAGGTSLPEAYIRCNIALNR